MDGPEDEDPGVPTLAERLNHLIQTVHPAGRKAYSLEEIAKAITEAGTPISAQYLWLLRRGDRTNPTKRHMEALAKFFGVPPAYFLDPDLARETDAQLGILAAMRDAQVRSVALRAAGLSPDTLAAIQSIIEGARRLEGLPETAPEQGDDAAASGTA